MWMLISSPVQTIHNPGYTCQKYPVIFVLHLTTIEDFKGSGVDNFYSGFFIAVTGWVELGFDSVKSYHAHFVFFQHFCCKYSVRTWEYGFLSFGGGGGGHECSYMRPRPSCRSAT